MADFAMQYSTLHEAKKDMHDLAGRVGPTLNDGVFADLGAGERGDAEAVFGNEDLALGFRSLYRLAKGPMSDAEKQLRELGDLFGAVSDAFFEADAQIAAGMGAMGSTLGLSDWLNDKAAWDYRNEHLSECVPGADGTMPDFCKATDPGPPPVDQYIATENGGVRTRLTLDDEYHVMKEEMTVTSGDQSYTTTTTYSDDRRSYTTTTVLSGGGTTVSEVKLDEHGGGTMIVTDPDGEKTEYRRSGPDQKWEPTKPPPGSGSGASSSGAGRPATHPAGGPSRGLL
ncbi:hypothetical protein AB0K60_19795 [Thermopolyspora sp. NPDC052614]|uniref:hypothetical protein n=1 Tax=Thermopolyspora sp. NPDC052614 TaxID=3155682 RepID=UPI00342C30BA